MTPPLDGPVGTFAPLSADSTYRRTWSLRREWSRAFAIMLALLLLAGATTFVGVRDIVGQFSGTAHRLDRESTVVASPQPALGAPETIAHQLVNGLPAGAGVRLAGSTAAAAF